MLWQVLNNIGLTEKESKVYLALLSLGAQAASVVAKKAGLNRTTTYLTLEELKNKGLVNTSNKGKLLLFQANDPSCLEKFIDTQKQNIIKKEFLLQNNLPYIRRLVQSEIEKPKSETYEGLNSIKNMLNSLLKSDNNMYAYFNIENLPINLKIYFEKEFFIKRFRLNCPIKIISEESIKNNKVFNQSQDERYKIEIKVCPKQNLQSGILIISDDKIGMINVRDQSNIYGNLIENKCCSDIMINSFEAHFNSL
jgi:sugar-specific transcriptional regulator TrmB